MGVPFIDLRRFEEGFIDTWVKKVEEMSRTTQFVGGPEVAALEKRLAEENGAKHAVGCSSGTDAIQLALRAANVGRGDIVLVPDLTFWATYEAVINVNADPVCVDINRDDLQMDFDRFKEAVEKYSPKAAIIVHLYGWGSARINEYRSFCKEKGITLVEDGAQSYGVEWKGESIYKNAELGTISFYPAKTLGAAGDAGAVITNSDELAEKMRSLANHGRELHYAHGDVGWNARMSSLQAAYLNISMDHFPKRLESRQKLAARYHEVLTEIGVKSVRPPEGYKENGYLNVTLYDTDKRDAIKKVLQEKEIGVGIVYPGPVSEQKGAPAYLKGLVGGENAKWLSGSVLNLPLFPYMTDAEFDEVIAAVKSAIS